LSNVQNFGGRGAGVVRDVLISEESARQGDPGAVLHDIEAFVKALLECARYDRSDFPPATLASGGLALYIGGVNGGGHSGFLQYHGSELFNFVKPGIALAGLSGSLGPIWSGYEAYIAAEGRPEPYPEDGQPIKLSKGKLEKLLEGLFPPDPFELYFPEEAWRSPVLQDLDNRFNAVSDDAAAQLKRFVLALPNVRLLPSADWMAELKRLWSK
jgi:hypothetical protein